jgi:asparagine synthase (glutamine-hydrolysing)
VCGIAGIISKRARFSAAQLAEIAKAMADTMAYRGPDDSGVWVDPDGHCALSHRRLSIIDLSSAGHQPMIANNGQSGITFNGEIYNFLELKPELEAKGHRFHTRTDTEVLMAAIEHWSVDSLAKLDAMFAFGHYDSRKQELILARDIFGEKPLYYVDTDRLFAFASELHALQYLPDFDARIDVDTVANYFAFQYIPCPDGIYQRVRKLSPGCYLRLRSGRPPEVGRYFNFATSAEQTSVRSLDDLADELEGILTTSVRRRLISDVPLGAFLSGGVDSSTIAALTTKKLHLPLKTFSIDFAGHQDSEHFDAAAIARHLGTEHNEQVLDGYPVDLGRHIATILDEPNADSSCVPTYLVSRHTRETVTVALSGDGGDELFGGYNRYFVTVDEDARNAAGDPPWQGWTRGSVYVSSRLLINADADIERLFGKVPPGLAARLAQMRSDIDHDARPLINVIREFDAHNYLPGAVLAKVDRMSMQHSLEVRAPLLGMDVAKFAMKLSAADCYGGQQGKLVLKRMASRYLPLEWLQRPKRGFGIPIEMWGKESLLPVTRSLVEAPECRLRNWIEPKRLVATLDHLEQTYHPYQCWSLFILELWLRHHQGIEAATAAAAVAKGKRRAETVAGIFARLRTFFNRPQSSAWRRY